MPFQTAQVNSEVCATEASIKQDDFVTLFALGCIDQAFFFRSSFFSLDIFFPSSSHRLIFQGWRWFLSSQISPSHMFFRCLQRKQLGELLCRFSQFLIWIIGSQDDPDCCEKALDFDGFDQATHGKRRLILFQSG